jgi:hypothetical protein
MAKTRAQLQAQRNKAVVAQRQAKLKSGIGSPAHLKAIATTKSLGTKMRARVAANDKSKAAFVITVGNVDEYVKSDGTLKQKTSVAPSGSTTSTGTTTTTGGVAGGAGNVMSIPSTFTRTRMGYDPDTSVDMTNTNPAYWNSAIAYFKAHPEGNPLTGELGIWIPNFEKQGAESVALAFIAGGGTAHVDSNYANNTVDDAYAKKLHRDRGDMQGAAGSYRGGAEKAIRLNSISRGGTDVDTGRPMGGTDPIGYGAHILGGRVVKGAMPGYLKDGGDFGGLLGVGTSITGSMLTGLLGGMDKDGMRLRGTMPSVMGATGSGVGAGGTATSIGSLYGRGGGISGGAPVVPTFMSDWSKFMPKNFSLGEAMYDTAGKEVAPGGFLYQPHTADYLGGMSVPGGAGVGGGYGAGVGGGYGAGAGGGLLGGSPPVTYTPPTAFGSPALTVAAVGSSAGTRDGLTAGMHSSHLGAYETADGTWVWGPRPSASGDAGEIGAGAVSHTPGEDVTMGYGLLGMTPWGAVPAHDITPSAVHTTYASDTDLDAAVAAFGGLGDEMGMGGMGHADAASGGMAGGMGIR